MILKWITFICISLPALAAVALFALSGLWEPGELGHLFISFIIMSFWFFVVNIFIKNTYPNTKFNFGHVIAFLIIGFLMLFPFAGFFL